VRQWHEAILGAFAAMHVDHHPIGIDVGDFQVKGFLQAQPAGVHRTEKSVVVRRSHAGQHRAHFLARQNGGQSRFASCPQIGKQPPIASENAHEEEANPAIADSHGVGRPVIDITAVQKVGFQINL
jgi:hypothetical protein